jgi:hypothetical protein
VLLRVFEPIEYRDWEQLGGGEMTALFMSWRSWTSFYLSGPFWTARIGVLEGLKHFTKSSYYFRELIMGKILCHLLGFRWYCFWWGNCEGSLSFIWIGKAIFSHPTVIPSVHTGIYLFLKEDNRDRLLEGVEFEPLAEIVNPVPAGALESQGLWEKSDRSGGLPKSRPEVK